MDMGGTHSRRYSVTGKVIVILVGPRSKEKTKDMKLIGVNKKN